MAAVRESSRDSPFARESNGQSNLSASQILPILPSTGSSLQAADDPMDIHDPTTGAMGPPSHMDSPITNGSRSIEGSASQQGDGLRDSTGAQQAVGAAAAAQQPKVVQTAFIHKLYSMLEDQTIQHLISWSNTSESFVMSPSSEFSKVLACVCHGQYLYEHGLMSNRQYFKHTNISSFVRQLNMYGFHKVSDVFHTGSPDSPLWEFKHGAGSFKRGDLAGLRDIKRRASRHALIHRDSFSAGSSSKPSLPTQSGTTMEPMPDPVETRLNILEWNQTEIHGRLSRTEEAYTAISSRCQSLMESLARCHQWTQSLSSHLLSIFPDPDSPVHRDLSAMREDIARQVQNIKTMDEVQDALGLAKPPFSLTVEPSTPISPRQADPNSSRRPSLQTLGRPESFRSINSQHLQASPRRYDANAASGGYSPNSSRSNFPPPPPPPSTIAQSSSLLQQAHPLASASSPPQSLSRRHTSADIRVHGWPGGQPPLPPFNHGSSPYASGQSSSAWPSSPRVAAVSASDQQLQDTLNSYELSRTPSMSLRPASPPAPNDTGLPSFGNSFASGVAPRFPGASSVDWSNAGRSTLKRMDNAVGSTRRASTARTVQELLNPTESAEQSNEDDPADDRKRKRVG